MSDALLTYRIRRELRSRGVTVNRLLFAVSDGRVVLSGEVGSYYELQQIQCHAAPVCEGRELVLNLVVVPSTFDLTRSKLTTSEAVQQLHTSRNRLNELTLAVRLLEKQLELGDIAQARTLVSDLLKSFSNKETERLTSIDETRILVIEDDTHQCLLLSGLLRHIGAEVASACDANSAYRVLNEGFTPTVVLLDMHLPVEDGASIARAIRFRHDCGQTKIIAVSGTHPNDIGLDLEAGDVDAWLPKPVNVDKLIQAIAQVQKTHR